MKTTVFGLGVFLLAAGLIGVAVYADHDEDEKVEELMEKTHEGKRSPYRQLRTQAEAAAPSWQVVEKTLPGFEAMSKALRESKNADIKGSADGYVDAVKEIAAATKQKDAKLLRAGFQALSQSCGDCHFKGGVGGELDD